MPLLIKDGVVAEDRWTLLPKLQLTACRARRRHRSLALWQTARCALRHAARSACARAVRRSRGFGGDLATCRHPVDFPHSWTGRLLHRGRCRAPSLQGDCVPRRLACYQLYALTEWASTPCLSADRRSTARLAGSPTSPALCADRRNSAPVRRRAAARDHTWCPTCDRCRYNFRCAAASPPTIHGLRVLSPPPASRIGSRGLARPAPPSARNSPTATGCPAEVRNQRPAAVPGSTTRGLHVRFDPSQRELPITPPDQLSRRSGRAGDPARRCRLARECGGSRPRVRALASLASWRITNVDRLPLHAGRRLGSRHRVDADPVEVADVFEVRSSFCWTLRTSSALPDAGAMPAISGPSRRRALHLGATAAMLMILDRTLRDGGL